MILFTTCNVYSAEAEFVAEICPPNPDMSGIVVTKDNRIFLGFPRHADHHNLPSLAEYKNGELLPFPDKNSSERKKVF